jgi:glycosyltransferase involved in cell wall biosynthesis
VPDLATEYARARLAISPVSLGAGTKIKVVEACAFGRPVVATSHSARGFEAAFAGDMAVADSPARFIDACARFLSDPALADRAGTALQAAQQAHFSFDAATTRIADDLRALIDAHQPDRAGSLPQSSARLSRTEVTS